MKRLGAALVAVAMVAAAWWVRTSFIDDDSGGGNAGGERLDLLCGSELADVCDRLAAEDDSLRVTVVYDGTTTDDLSVDGATAGFDAWLSAGPWPAIVADNRAAAGLRTDPLGETSRVLGRSPVTLVGPTDRVEALEQHCGGTISWSCVGDVSGQPWSTLGGAPAWGAFRTGLTPVDTGGGLVALDQAVANRSGTTEWSTTELDDVSDWLSQLVGAATFSNDPLDVMLTRPGSFSLTAPLERRSGPAFGRADTGNRFRLLYPEPMVTADVTLSAATGESVDALLDRLGGDRLARTLTEAGWRLPGQPSPFTVNGSPELPKGSGLTTPGALQALRTTVQEMRP